MQHTGGRWVVGIAGAVAIGVGRGISMDLIGFFLVRAALTFKAAEASGFDGALRRLTVETWGVPVVSLLATIGVPR